MSIVCPQLVNFSSGEDACFIFENVEIDLHLLIFELPHKCLGRGILDIQFVRNLGKGGVTRLIGIPSSITPLNSLIFVTNGILAYLQPLRDAGRLPSELS